MDMIVLIQLNFKQISNFCKSCLFFRLNSLGRGKPLEPLFLISLIFVQFKANLVNSNFYYFNLFKTKLKARSLVVSDLRSETKGSRYEPGYYLCAEVSSLQ